MSPETRVSDQDLAADIARVAKSLDTERLSRSAYLQHGQFSSYDIYDGGRTWEDLCALAHVACMKNEPVPDDLYFQRLATAVGVLGRLPKTGERKKFRLNFSKRRYPNLTAFFDTAAELGYIDMAFRSSAHGSVSEPLRDPSPKGAAIQTARPVPPIPLSTKRTKWERTGISGFPYAPQDELGVVALFAVLCSTGTIQWQILELRGGKGIDSTCFDHVMQREIRVELKFLLSRGSWNHRAEEIDYVVCWENRWFDFPKPVIVLRELLAGISPGVA
jgi:hypothetical protein